jgi:hypothetical protein
MGWRIFWRDAPSGMRFGLTLTITWLTLIAGYSYLRWSDVRSLPPNSLGDFVAGICAPLAFLWLVVAVFLQKDELRQNTSALNLQAAELKHAVKQYTDQTELWRDERKSAKFTEEERRLDELIDDLVSNISLEAGRASVRYGGGRDPEIAFIFGSPSRIIARLNAGQIDSSFHEISRGVTRFHLSIAKFNPPVTLPPNWEHICSIQSAMEAILTDSKKLRSDVIDSRLKLAMLEDICSHLREIVKLMNSCQTGQTKPS